MSESLLAILLATSSAKGSSLVYRWPPLPQAQPRLARPRPKENASGVEADNPWRAANLTDLGEDTSVKAPIHNLNREDDDYFWRRPNALRGRSMSLSHSPSHPTSRRASPSKDPNDSFPLDGPLDHPIADDEYFEILGYPADFLANLLCPNRAMSHQKFELIVDDLAFIGHPVCCDPDGIWRFKAEKTKPAPRGRGSKKGQSPHLDDLSLTPEKLARDRQHKDDSWLRNFHLVFVLDLPDPSSSSAGNLSKYFNAIYEQVAFVVTAVLYQEQIVHNFVEAECDTLGNLETECISKGISFADYMTQALTVSTVASSMKTLYESIKENTLARITINEFPLEVQLPPFLDELIRNDETIDADTIERDLDDTIDSGVQPWGADMNIGWRLPLLAPWKALLHLNDDGDQGYELYMKLKGPQLTPQDRELAEQLIKFLDLADITLCLADMASLLDWDLESQVYPTVRWLVHHRRAKLVDLVHPDLKTVFTVASTLPTPLAELSVEFASHFAHPSIPPLPILLSMITSATSEQATNHFYATVVRSKELIPIYKEVLVWLFKKDLLVTLHLRIRVVAPEPLKKRVRIQKSLSVARRGRIVRSNTSNSLDNMASGEKITVKVKGPDSVSSGVVTENSPADYWISMSPKEARRRTRELSPEEMKRNASRKSIKSVIEKAEDEDDMDENEDDISIDSSDEWEDEIPTMIDDPGRASRKERRFLAAMSEGKEPYIAKLFQQINQYFNGKCTDDEILYRAEITRKQLREILHVYEDFLQTFLHPA